MNNNTAARPILIGLCRRLNLTVQDNYCIEMCRQTLHLHAGFHKTGSSAIQDYLYSHDVDPNYHYFQSGIPNSSLIIRQAFKVDLTDNQQVKAENLSEREVSNARVRAREEISRIITRIDRPHTILSAESISLLTPDEIQDVYEFFNAYYDEIFVYIYLRPNKSRIESAFQEVLKTRYRSIDQKFPIIFETLIGKFDKVFGRSNVFVSKYSRDEFRSGNVVDHFLGQIGVDSSVVEPWGDVNTSLSLPASQLLYIYRKYFPNRDGRDLKRVQKLQQLVGDPFRFHSQLYKELIITRKGDFSWLEQRTGFTLAENIEAHDAYGVRGEADLIQVSEEALDWLSGHPRNIFGRLRTSTRSLKSLAKAVRRL